MLPLERYPYGQKSRSQTALLGRVLLWVRVGLDWKPLTSRDQYSNCAQT
jgi:hypothetical protein